MELPRLPRTVWREMGAHASAPDQGYDFADEQSATRQAAMTFPEQAAELHRLAAVATSLGLSERAFEALVFAILDEQPDASPEAKLEEIRKRVMATARTKTPAQR